MAFAKLNMKGLALTSAILWGAYMFLAPLFEMFGISGLWWSSEMFAMIATIYPGVTATFLGAFIGLFWGVVCGAICGGLFGWIYNKFD